MHCVPQVGFNKKQAKKRAIAFAFLVCFVAASLLSEAFILTHADHEHDQNGTHGTCATCAQIQSAESLLKQFGVAAAGSLHLLAGLFAAATIISAICLNVSTLTHIALKTRMNN